MELTIVDGVVHRPWLTDQDVDTFRRRVAADRAGARPDAGLGGNGEVLAAEALTPRALAFARVLPDAALRCCVVEAAGAAGTAGALRLVAVDELAVLFCPAAPPPELPLGEGLAVLPLDGPAAVVGRYGRPTEVGPGEVVVVLARLAPAAVSWRPPAAGLVCRFTWELAGEGNRG